MTGRLRARAARWLAGGSSGSPQELWSAVDDYICRQLLPLDPVLEAALDTADAAGLPPITTAPNQGRLLELLIRMHGSRRVLELGTLAGYSTIWMARALPPGGRLVTLEYDPRHAEVARENIASAGLAGVVELHVGPALETLPQLAEGEPFDLVFIDADNRNLPEYLRWSLRLSRPGSLIIADNVIGGGAILHPEAEDPWREQGGIEGVRRFFEELGAESRLSATAIQTVGSKGYDGLAIALVEEPA